MIGHTPPFVFIHVPKTAGTSLTEALGPYGKSVSGPENRDDPYFRHASARQIRDALGPRFEGYYRFGFIRNPWDWCLSNYYFNRGMHLPYRSGTRWDTQDITPKKGYNVPRDIMEMAFPDWLDWWLETLRPSMLGLMCDETGTILVDDVFCVERIDRDFGTIKRRLGLPEDLVLHRRNVTSQREAGLLSEQFGAREARRVGDYFHREAVIGDYRCR
ncbi:sulfotransferase family 2 domain-containing protein [Pseudoroseicyclus aestuarii]|uniref:Sulfotransferase family protein n=1 Tax=Pseudoroseicyclus aestuarii TaxID=1795041 RepID=A0A318SSD1_9RHOB|nr:sulfotransferase family 2 domain-containing protein [Pseudoroseicyclus aestuarii]PYE82172.1 sulfotransferase family protein [Pseudoroseicyclus aestuarii]